MVAFQNNGPAKTSSKEEVVTFLTRLAEAMKSCETVFSRELSEIHPDFQVSARNLLHYLQLRSEEIRPLQQFLHDVGLSSLTSSESHTLSQLQQVVRWLEPTSPTLNDTPPCTFFEARDLAKKHLVGLLGKKSKKKVPHIMVTVSKEITSDHDLIEELLDAGMTVARINCAHDDESVWLEMIQSIRTASKPCKIYMDLSGPRIRVAEVPFSKKVDGLVLEEGDIIEITVKNGGARKASFHSDERVKKYARIVVQPGNIMQMLETGQRIFFDDGKFEAKVIAIKKKRIRVQVTRISTKNPVLRAEKGMNLPDSKLVISSLTDSDLKSLPFIAEHADVVGYSFVGGPEDLRELRSHLREINKGNPGIILKIERLSAVQNLPALLLEGMKDEKLGVMIARGDLAVEIGFERLSEIQQEILWICEAAHVPVVWATQVLERLNKTGYATRSEITDAAMSAMAECVMLNKGKYVVKTVNTLVDILKRFLAHSDKKRFTFRPLSIATSFIAPEKNALSEQTTNP